MNEIGEGLLLREHAHRVANDMAVASAALRMVERRVGPDPVLAIAISRMEASARIQRLLCGTPTGEAVDLSGVLKRLCEEMGSAHAGQPLSIDVAVPSLLVVDGEAWLLSMCVHELVGNAIRHGGPSGAGIRVEAIDDGARTTLRVLDRGGLREWTRPGGQGAVIVDRLVARLGGRVRRSAGRDGGRVEIVVPTLAVASVVACVEA